MNKIIIKLLGITAQVILSCCIIFVFYATTIYPFGSHDVVKDLFDILGRITLVMGIIVSLTYLITEINRKIK